jgi:hypothetical protein
MPSMTTLSTPEAVKPDRRGIHRAHVLYPNRYTWYVLVSALDIMITVTLLVHLGAREVNMLAQESIELFGTWGLIGLKFLSVILVVGICEWVGRRNFRLGRRVATAAIFISLFPITAAVLQVGFVLVMGDLDWEPHPHQTSEFVHPELVPHYLPGMLPPLAAPTIMGPSDVAPVEVEAVRMGN